MLLEVVRTIWAQLSEANGDATPASDPKMRARRQPHFLRELPTHYDHDGRSRWKCITFVHQTQNEGHGYTIPRPMSTTSAKTIRIRGIAADTSQSRFEVDCVVSGSLNESRPRFSWSSPFVSSPSPTEIRTSLARQSDSQTATVTFQTEQLKSKALLQSYPAEWVLDDQFNGLTILHTPDEDEDINVEYVFRHF